MTLVKKKAAGYTTAEVGWVVGQGRAAGQGRAGLDWAWWVDGWE